MFDSQHFGLTAARHETVRSNNLALVLRHVMASESSISRADLAANLGVSRSTASRLVDDLIDSGLLEEGLPTPGSRGRPSVPVKPSTQNIVSLGIEINVERIVVVAIDLLGNVLAQSTMRGDFVQRDPKDVLDIMVSTLNEVKQQLPTTSKSLGTRIAIPGLISNDGTKVLKAPNLHWSDLNINNLLEPYKNQIPGGLQRVSNDVDCSALTILEKAPGRPREISTFLFVSGEVGIGSSVAVNGNQLTGAHGWANEFGHICVLPDGPLCGCGAKGCVEALAGAQALKKTTGSDTIDELIIKLESEDKLAIQSVNTAATALGIALSSTLNILDIPNIIISGHLSKLSQWILPIIKSEIRDRVMWAQYLPIDISTEGPVETNAALGAAYGVISEALEDPAIFVDK